MLKDELDKLYEEHERLLALLEDVEASSDRLVTLDREMAIELLQLKGEELEDRMDQFTKASVFGIKK